MSETKAFCPTCGTHLAPATTTCPGCGAQFDATGALIPPPGGIAGFILSVKKNKWGWLIGSVLAVGGVVGLMLLGGAFGPSGATVCTVSLKQAKDFGVISQSASLDSSSASSTDVKNRKSCAAKVGEETFTLTADIKSIDANNMKCRDYLKQPGCIKLYSVARNDGMTTYQVREIPPNETDEALIKEGVLSPVLTPSEQKAQQEQQQHAAEEHSAMDAETAVDNSAATQSAPAAQ